MHPIYSHIKLLTVTFFIMGINKFYKPLSKLKFLYKFLSVTFSVCLTSVIINSNLDKDSYVFVWNVLFVGEYLLNVIFNSIFEENGREKMFISLNKVEELLSTNEDYSKIGVFASILTTFEVVQILFSAFMLVVNIDKQSTVPFVTLTSQICSIVCNLEMIWRITLVFIFVYKLKRIVTELKYVFPLEWYENPGESVLLPTKEGRYMQISKLFKVYKSLWSAADDVSKHFEFSVMHITYIKCFSSSSSYIIPTAEAYTTLVTWQTCTFFRNFSSMPHDVLLQRKTNNVLKIVSLPTYPV